MMLEIVHKSLVGFWRNRSSLALKLWVWIHIAIFMVLEALGLIPGLSHSIDFFTVVYLDEIIQLLMVKPAVKELWRRQFLKEIEEGEQSS